MFKNVISNMGDSWENLQNTYQKDGRMFHQLQTWEQVCWYNYLLLSNKVHWHPTWDIETLKTRSFKGDNREFYLKEFSLYGFCTLSSQASEFNKDCICYLQDPPEDTPWVYSYDCRTKEYCTVQKACVNGTMPKELSEIMISELSKHPRIVFHIGSVISDNFPEVQRKTWIHIKGKALLFDCVKESKDELMKEDISEYIPTRLENKSDLVFADIMDSKANDDQYLWKTILEILEKNRTKIQETKLN